MGKKLIQTKNRWSNTPTHSTRTVLKLNTLVVHMNTKLCDEMIRHILVNLLPKVTLCAKCIHKWSVSSADSAHKLVLMIFIIQNYYWYLQSQSPNMSAFSFILYLLQLTVNCFIIFLDILKYPFFLIAVLGSLIFFSCCDF